ncbi:MAG TPA: hypothetical protein VK891_18600, partial [Euzebyales bacterium]|nr:hypothetical protein [Euzebyales bacterium]
MPTPAPSPLLNGARRSNVTSEPPATSPTAASATRVEIDLLVAGTDGTPVAITVDADPAAPVAALARALVDVLPDLSD